MDAIRLLPLFLVVPVISAVTDPCNNCSLPVGFNATDGSLCQNIPIDDTYAPTFIRYPLGTECYLQITDCPAYDVISDSNCAGILPPQEALRCVNGTFRVPGLAVEQPIEKIRCSPYALNNTVPNCTAGGWKYNWMTDSYFKLGYNKSYEDAKAACIAEGGQLASIHSQEENDFILLLTYIENKEASIGEGIFVWIGVEADGERGFRNLDGTPFDYSFWGAPNPSGDGSCIRMTTGPRYDVPGVWNDLRCSADTHAYACRKSPEVEVLTTCPGCEPITRGTPSGQSDNTAASLWAIYEDTPNGCTATIKCKSTLLGANVYLNIENSSLSLGEDYNEVTVSGRYNCMNGIWRDLNYPNFNGTNDYLEMPTKLVCTQGDDIYNANECKRCKPVVQLSTSEQGFINGKLSISYTTVDGCVRSTITCSSTKPNYKVALYDGQTKTLLGESCNTVFAEYTCKNRSIWDPSQSVICKQSRPETCPGTACSSCPPITQATMLGMPSGTLSVSYDMSNGCTRANLKCTATAPGNKVTMVSNYGYVFGERCNEIRFDAGFICQNTSAWVDAEGNPAAPQAACVQNEDSGC